MNILIFYHHFWPDSTPYASMLRSIAKKLVLDGHRVSVLCEQPNYKTLDRQSIQPSFEKLDGIEIIRLSRFVPVKAGHKLKTIAKLLFPFRAWLYCLSQLRDRDQYDLVWTATNPPIISGAVGLRLARRYNAKFLYHCQDLYPEIGIHMGALKPDGLLCRVLYSVEKHTRARANIVVSLSKDMANSIESSISLQGRHIVLNNFQLENFDEERIKKKLPISESEASVNDAINLIFAGNMGQFQGLEQIVQALLSLGDHGRKIQCRFLGEGKVLESLKQLSKDAPNIEFLPHVPYAQAKEIIAQADYGLVSLEPDIYRFAYPSKVLTYLSLNVPLAVVVETNSQLVQTVEKNALGHYACGHDIDSIASMFKEMIDQKHCISLHKDNVKRFYELNCSRDSVLERWSECIGSLEEPNKNSHARQPENSK